MRGRLGLAVAAVVLQAAVVWRPALAQPATPPAAITVTVTCDPNATTFSVEVQGVNFSPFTAVLVTFDADTGGRPESPPVDPTTDGFGRFDVTFRPQLQRPPGTYLVRADDFREREATAPVAVACQVFNPTIRFDPAITRGGFDVALIGSGFPLSAPVLIDWGGLLGRDTRVTTYSSDSKGNLSIQILVFQENQLGTVTATAKPGPEAFTQATAKLLIVPGTAQPPALEERR